MALDLTPEQLEELIASKEREIRRMRARIERPERVLDSIKEQVRKQGHDRFFFVRGSGPGMNVIHVVPPAPGKRKVVRIATVDRDEIHHGEGQEPGLPDDRKDPGGQQAGLDYQLGVELGEGLARFAVDAVGRGIDGLALRVALARERASMLVQREEAARQAQLEAQRLAQAPPPPPATPPPLPQILDAKGYALLLPEEE